MAKTPDLHHVDTWVFDLDNTLYSPGAGLLDQVGRLMTAFIAERLGLSATEAGRVRRHYWRRYGATLTGLMAEHDVDRDEFLAACHAIDLGGLAPDPALCAAVGDLPGRRLIHTNGPRQHALRVLGALGLADHFERVITIEDTGYRAKPAVEAHARAAAIAGLVAARTAVIDDMARNLEHPGGMGMTTVWVRHGPARSPPEHVDHTTDDLAGFLIGAVGGRVVA